MMFDVQIDIGLNVSLPGHKIFKKNDIDTSGWFSFAFSNVKVKVEFDLPNVFLFYF